LSDPGEYSVGGAPTVLFQVKLSFEGLVDRLDPLADTAEVSVAVGLVLAVGAQQLDAVRCGGGGEVPAGEALVGQHDLSVADQMLVVFQQCGHDLALTDLGAGQAPHDRHAVAGADR
jgi:hypothetical protein